MTQDMSDTPTPGPRRGLWRKRYLLLIPIGAFATLYWISSRSSDGVLDRLRARGYPTTSLELDRWYVSVPSEQNLSGPILRAAGAFRYQALVGSSIPFLAAGANEPSPQIPAPADELARWRQVIESNAETWSALAEARTRTEGHYPINLSQGMNTILNHLAPLKSLVQACALRALVCAEEQKPAESLEALRDIYLVRRSILSEPTLISTLVGFALDSIGTRAVRDCLERTRFTDAQLVLLSEDLRSIASTNCSERGFVGELANGRSVFTGGAAALVSVAGPGPGGAPSAASQLGVGVLQASGILAADESFFLQKLSAFIDATRQPFPQGLDAAETAEAELTADLAKPSGKLKLFSRVMLPALAKAIAKGAADQANLRMTQTALAIERFRLAHGRTPPDALAALVPEYLPVVPTDPFDGKPIRYRRTDSGYVLHCIGSDRKDGGGLPTVVDQKGRPIANPDFVFEVRR